MPTPVDHQAVEQRARALLEDRIVAVRTLATARQHQLDTHARVREELDSADRADAAAYAAALRAGWTDDELKNVGFDAPTRKTPGRPRRTRTTAQRAQRSLPADAAPTSDASGHRTPEDS